MFAVFDTSTSVSTRVSLGFMRTDSSGTVVGSASRSAAFETSVTIGEAITTRGVSEMESGATNGRIALLMQHQRGAHDGRGRIDQRSPAASNRR